MILRDIFHNLIFRVHGHLENRWEYRMDHHVKEMNL
jgi:hypothetical protein